MRYGCIATRCLSASVHTCHTWRIKSPYDANSTFVSNSNREIHVQKVESQYAEGRAHKFVIFKF